MTANTADAAHPLSTARSASTRWRRPRLNRQPVGARQSRLNRILVIAGLLLFALYSVAPVWWLTVSVTKSQPELYGASGWRGMWFAATNHFWDNLKQLTTYDGGYFFRWMFNSVFYAGVGSLVCTVISVAAGYGLSRYEFAGRKYVLGLVVASFLVPSALLTVPMYLVFAKTGLVGSMWGVLIPIFISPFSVYLAKVYVDGAVPVELIEAARIDGAGELRIFIQVVMRLMSTGAATIYLLSFVAAWNGFFQPLVILGASGKANWTLALGLYNWSSARSIQGTTYDGTSIVLIGSLLSIIPLAAFMLAMQRYWKSGVTLGSLK